MNKRFMVVIRDGVKVDKAELTVFAESHDDAEAWGNDVAKVLDATAYVDSVYELA